MLKQQVNIKHQKSNIKYTNQKCKNIFIFLVCIFYFLYFIFCFSNAYALNLEKPKVYFLKGDYDMVILECEKILGNADYSKDLDELYYLLGLSYLKNGNFLRASDIFEIILKEFKESNFRDSALLGLGDAYFLKGDYNKAKVYYEELIKNFPQTKLQPAVYYRLSQTGFKMGDIQEAKIYLDKLKQDYPLNIETRLENDSTFLDLYYTVQVGSFSNDVNARNLMQKLKDRGYPAYIEEASSQGKIIYRVRVGKLKARQDAEALENKLKYEGYPTKLYP